jgi:hypothetical protein
MMMMMLGAGEFHLEQQTNKQEIGNEKNVFSSCTAITISSRLKFKFFMELFLFFLEAA